MQSFQEQGFVKTKVNAFDLSPTASDDLNIIKNNFDSLSRDPYADKSSNRFRAYSNLVIIPWEKKLYWIPPVNKNGQFVSKYWQGGFNPDHKDSVRYFTPLTSATKNTLFLKNLIFHDFDLTFWDTQSTLPIYVGVHFIKLLVIEKNQIAFSSPDLLHRDGEAFTFAHLFNRYNVKGGTNYISKPEFANHKIGDIMPNDILSQFEMHDQMETYGVCDALVSHYVSPIQLDNQQLSYGRRDIILIDFSSVQQELK